MSDFPDDMLIEQFSLSCRAHNCLVNNEGVRTVGEVRAKSDVELLRLPNFGRKSLNEMYEIGILNETDRPLIASSYGTPHNRGRTQRQIVKSKCPTCGQSWGALPVSIEPFYKFCL